jgi:hypothetical protein
MPTPRLDSDQRRQGDSLRGVTRRDAEDRIRELALSFPETYEDDPWGHWLKCPEHNTQRG